MNQQELKNILELHRKWVVGEEGGARAVLRGADLRDAVLSGAVLRGADLSGADLSRADLSGADLSRADLRGADLSRADLRGADLSRADLRGADLRRADLSGADLRSADLRSAVLRSAELDAIKADYFQRMALQPNEILGLYKALIDGRIKGSSYEGECACFCGTLANVAKVKHTDLVVKPDATSPTERWYLAINEGDTPTNNPISKITADWTREFLEQQGVKIPERRVVWEDET
jgi:hypothetical protein